MEYFTIKEVAEELSTNEETVRRWIRNGKLQATRRASKLGYLISSDDLKSFLEW